MEYKSRSVYSNPKIAVVIPAFKVKNHIYEVVNSIGSEVTNIIVVDDACPEGTGKFLSENCKDPRVEVIIHEINLGVGGAVKSGYERALKLEADIIVKIDGDGQMDPSKIMELIKPIILGEAEYTKGNRFFSLDAIIEMPKIRIIGNLALSFMNKLSSGYYKILDPTNGFTAIESRVLQSLNLRKLDNRFFFESDVLFRLNLLNVRIKDIPIAAIYNYEKSNLRITRVLVEFPFKHFRNFCKRIIYLYYLKDFSLVSIQLPIGLILSFFGTLLGINSWFRNNSQGLSTEPGTIVLVAMCCLVGIQLILSFLNYDMERT